MKTVAVTGATSGIGLAICRELAKNNFGLIGIGRSEENCNKALRLLSGEFPGASIIFFHGDLSRHSEVLRIGNAIREYAEDKCHGSLHALINNAGCVRSYYTTTEDGFETQFATNHLAGFLLTHILMPCLLNAEGRVLMTSSASHKMMKMRWNDLMFRRGYNPLLAYKQSKLCNMLFAYELHNRYSGRGISAYGIDPGLVNTDIGFKNTTGLVRLVWKLRQKKGVPPEIPAKTYAFLCNENKPPKGLYYYLCREEKYSKQVNRGNSAKLWALSEQFCGIASREEKI